MVPSAQLHGLLGSCIRGVGKQWRPVCTVLCAQYGIHCFEDQNCKSPGKFGNTAFLYTVTLSRNKIHNNLHLYFTFLWPCIVTNFFVIKPNRRTNFEIYFVMKLYMFQTFLLSIIRRLFTVHSAMVYVLQVCRQLLSRTILVLLESRLQTCMANTIAECTVNKLLMTDRGTDRNM